MLRQISNKVDMCLSTSVSSLSFSAGSGVRWGTEGSLHPTFGTQKPWC